MAASVGPKEESFARFVFQAAIAENRCAELWKCLTEGGSATVDASTRKLVLYPVSYLEGYFDRPPSDG